MVMLFMTTINAISSVSGLTAANIERINYRSPDPPASGFQQLVQTQVTRSRSYGSNEPAVQKQSVNMSPHRADTDAMLAQLLASRKLLLQPVRSVSVSGKTKREDVTECSLDDSPCTETPEISHTEYTHKLVSGLCEKISKKHHTIRCDPCGYGLITNYQFECQQPLPAVVTAPLTNIFIWVPPEIIRAPVSTYKGQPLRIRKLRLLDRTGYRQDGRGQN